MSKHFFFDPSFVFESSGFDLRIQHPKKVTTGACWVDPMQSEARDDIPDWEYRVSILYPYCIYDKDAISVDGVSSAEYRIWYEASAIANAVTGRKWLDHIIDKDNSRGVELGDFENLANGKISPVHPDPYFALCYMESHDGINWYRPECSEFYYKKEDGSIVNTNIVFIGEHGSGVMKNTHPMAGRGEPAYLFACAHDGVAISCSDNGIHWERPIRVVGEYDTKVHIKADTDNHIFWSSEVGRYLILTRGMEYDKQEPLRTVISIVGPKKLCAEDDGHIRDSIKTAFSYPTVALSGPLDAQPYSMPLRHLADGYYIGVVSMLNYDATKDFAYRVHASLSWSRDGVNWSYLFGKEPYIQNAEKFAIEKGNDYGMIYCGAPIEVEGEMRIYYAAIPELHYFHYEDIPEKIKRVVDEVIPEAKKARSITRTTSLNYVSFGIDRFAGLCSEEGVLRTKPIELKRGRISLTADIELCGEISARLLAEEGNSLPGFDYCDFEPLTESVTDAHLAWKGDLTSLKSKKVSLELSVKRSALYTVEID